MLSARELMSTPESCAYERRMLADFPPTQQQRSLIFTGPNVLAVLADTKTQTRRVVRLDERAAAALVKAEEPVDIFPGRFRWPTASNVPLRRHNAFNATSPFGAPGQKLWVRETFKVVSWHAYKNSVEDDGRRVQQTLNPADPEMAAVYRAGWSRSEPRPWSSPIYMPRWASRVVLEIVRVRLERLHAIDDSDATAEGASSLGGFAKLWDGINGKRASWRSNPFVWVLEFKRAAGT